MKMLGITVSALVFFMLPFVSDADEYESVKFGDAEVVLNYQPPQEGGATFTVSALVYETNDSLRGVRNSDQRRLSKLGQLIFQCKMLLHQADKSDSVISTKTPVLISKSYSLFTGVELSLEDRGGVGIQVQALPKVDDTSLFSPSLGGRHELAQVKDSVVEGDSINLKQLSLDVLNDSKLLDRTETLDISLRFPVFQMNRPVQQWYYSFNVKNFKQAIQYAEEYCSPAKLIDFINQ